MRKGDAELASLGFGWLRIFLHFSRGPCMHPDLLVHGSRPQIVVRSFRHPRRIPATRPVVRKTRWGASADPFAPAICSILQSLSAARRARKTRPSESRTSKSDPPLHETANATPPNAA